MRELELKLLLSARDHQALRTALGEPEAEFEQINEYFDACDRSWRRAELAVRVREERGHGVLTVKGAAPSQSGWTDRLESQRLLEPAELQRLRSEPGALDRAVRRLLGDRLPAQLSPLGLSPIGRLLNRRASYPRAEGRAELVLDETRYPDGSVQHELELEAADRALGAAEEAELRRLFARLGIDWRPGTASKLERLLRMLE